MPRDVSPTERVPDGPQFHRQSSTFGPPHFLYCWRLSNLKGAQHTSAAAPIFFQLCAHLPAFASNPLSGAFRVTCDYKVFSGFFLSYMVAFRRSHEDLWLIFILALREFPIPSSALLPSSRSSITSFIGVKSYTIELLEQTSRLQAARERSVRLSSIHNRLL